MHYFLLGPSGVGKTCFGNWLQDNRKYLHIPIDRGDEGSGWELEGFKELWEKEDLSPFASELDNRAKTSRKDGCVLTFPSVDFLDSHSIVTLAGYSIAVRYLYGDKEKCIEAFVNREKAAGHPERDRAFWSTNNEDNYRKIAGDELKDYRADIINASGKRLSGEKIAKILKIE
jgi:hypothetical protein